MWSISRNPLYARAASGATNEAIHLLRERRSLTLHGWYNGVIGSLCTIRKVTRILPNAQQIDDADLLQEVLTAPMPDDGSFDLIAGPSGTIAGLLSLREPTPDVGLLTACHNSAEWLLKRACKGPGIGLSWQEETNDGTNTYAPCGLAHGTSSAAHALLELWAVSGDDRYKEAAFRAFEYERQWFDRQQCGWPDLRGVGATDAGDPGKMVYPVYWCYGAGGIGLSRLRAWQLTGDKTALAEANAAVFACKQRARQALAFRAESDRFEENASLCHGLGSVIELLIYSAKIRHDPEALELAHDLGLVLAPAADEEWHCGVVGGGETPGLMLGLAGIGRMLLGLGAPDQYQPSGLVLPASTPRPID